MVKDSNFTNRNILAHVGMLPYEAKLSPNPVKANLLLELILLCHSNRYLKLILISE